MWAVLGIVLDIVLATIGRHRIWFNSPWLLLILVIRPIHSSSVIIMVVAH